MGVDVLANRLIKYVVRRAVGLPADDLELQRIVGSSRYIIMRKAVGEVASTIVTEKNGHLRCGICLRGPFTRKGLYLHLIRVHGNEILSMIEEKYREISKVYKDNVWY
ncbi:hypothetical protein Shell_1025 [Staphylothermus hellenicus DSM 12710]|uniref:Uncharacterized protein n=1 Tax=Staphylothermus hellenicus (strain DSM 12710 / JCM 10830 / BK20S6-10-b1 / P8) TaxID=591019 RepID=D7D8N4_STAHD|nr:hypothetical protein Shell_1025 [Staphylothermus hellenicus DSM 12710]